MKQPKKKNEPKKKLGRPAKLQVITEAQLNGMLPLDYMLAVIRDPMATQSRRDRMAISAAPYCHARIADVIKGKKEVEAEAAAAVVAGGGLSQWSDDLRAN